MLGCAPLQFGFEDAPHGHAEISFKNVAVPVENVVLGPGRGFEIAQGRLGPGRLHHCMRLMGAGQRALEMARDRATKREAFGGTLADMGGLQMQLARLERERCEGQDVDATAAFWPPRRDRET